MQRPELPGALWAVVVGLSALAGCAGGDGPQNAAQETSSTTVAAPSTSSPPVSSPTSTESPGCPGNDPVPPDGAQDVSEVSADVDGDGTDDRVLAYRRSDGARRLAVDVAAGGTAAVDASATEVEGPAPLSVLGGARLGGDGETVFALTDAGASVVIVGLFQFVDCALTRVSFPSSQEVELPVGGGITHGDGIACSDGALVRLSATSTDGETFTATKTSYQLDGTTLIEAATQTSTLTRAVDDEAINAYYAIDCPTLENSPGPL